MIPGRIVALAPMLAPCAIVDERLTKLLTRGKASFVKKQRSTDKHVVGDSQPVPKLHPALDSDSIAEHHVVLHETWSQMLQSRPMRAPGSTCANAQTRVASPTL